VAAVELDVLIVGGGSQGLWLLNDLTKRGYRAIVLERGALGAGQTCHSHALIHRGHYYDDIDMMIILNAAAQFWQAFVDEKGITKLNTDRALAGFGPGTAVDRHTYFWKTAGLRFDPCEKRPDVLEGGKVKTLFETEEFSLDAAEVMAGLAQDVNNAIYPLDDDGQAIEFVTDGRTVNRVEATIGGEQVELAPRFVVLSAGVGNYGLLAKLGSDRNPDPAPEPVQAQRKSTMLVVRGDALPMMTAVFPIRGGLQGVFLCPRTDHGTGQPVWLASDHNSTPFTLATDGTTELDSEPSPEWVQRMLTSLKATAPALFSDRISQTLDLAVYTGLTSERNFGVGQHMTDSYIDPLGFDNLLAIWPTKLTLTPFASNVGVRFIRPKVPDPSGPWPNVDRPIKAATPPLATEMWCRDEYKAPTECKTPWLPYEEFLGHWNVTQL
jgi:glycine/D-amino acid oxidase-like deaminating enzyme